MGVEAGPADRSLPLVVSGNAGGRSSGRPTGAALFGVGFSFDVVVVVIRFEASSFVDAATFRLAGGAALRLSGGVALFLSSPLRLAADVTFEGTGDVTFRVFRVSAAGAGAIFRVADDVPFGVVCFESCRATRFDFLSGEAPEPITVLRAAREVACLCLQLHTL